MAKSWTETLCRNVGTYRRAEYAPSIQHGRWNLSPLECFRKAELFYDTLEQYLEAELDAEELETDVR